MSDPFPYAEPELRVGGVRVVISDLVPRWEIVQINERAVRVPGMNLGVDVGVASGSIGPMYVHALTYFALTHDGRLPFETQYSTGAAEARRERRRRDRS